MSHIYDNKKMLISLLYRISVEIARGSRRGREERRRRDDRYDWI